MNADEKIEKLLKQCDDYNTALSAAMALIVQHDPTFMPARWSSWPVLVRGRKLYEEILFEQRAAKHQVELS